MKIAYLFPGQGSQCAGMGRDLHDNFASARAVFEEVDESLGEPLSRLCFQGPEEDLKLTQNTQPALLTVSAAAWAALHEAGPPPAPAYLAGHSLGEYSAHVAAGTLPCGDAARIVRKRGQYMQAAVPVGQGAMAAIIGLDAASVRALCSEIGDGAWISNENSPIQTVIGGRPDAVEAAGELARERGAKKVVMLEVSAPFHTPLMEPAQAQLQPDLESQTFADPTWPVIANVDAEPRVDGGSARDALVRQVTAPVRWTATLEFLRNEGIDTLAEIGAGKVLSGLARRVSRDWTVMNVGDAEGVRAALDAFAKDGA